MPRSPFLVEVMILDSSPPALACSPFFSSSKAVPPSRATGICRIPLKESSRHGTCARQQNRSSKLHVLSHRSSTGYRATHSLSPVPVKKGFCDQFYTLSLHLTVTLMSILSSRVSCALFFTRTISTPDSRLEVTQCPFWGSLGLFLETMKRERMKEGLHALCRVS